MRKTPSVDKATTSRPLQTQLASIPRAQNDRALIAHSRRFRERRLITVLRRTTRAFCVEMYTGAGGQNQQLLGRSRPNVNYTTRRRSVPSGVPFWNTLRPKRSTPTFQHLVLIITCKIFSETARGRQMIHTLNATSLAAHTMQALAYRRHSANKSDQFSLEPYQVDVSSKTSSQPHRELSNRTFRSTRRCLNRASPWN